MAINNMNDGVGKKIVEALKMQSDDITSDNIVEEEFEEEENLPEYNADEGISPQDLAVGQNSPFISQVPPTQTIVDDAFQQSLAQNLSSVYSVAQDELEYPANVAIIKQLISKLPTGVTKQTGAIIIKQTMEALGISMNTVLQEARQFQETLINNSRECQNNVVEYRKQISILENKSQQYQRQSAAMSDIINLFLQTR